MRCPINADRPFPATNLDPRRWRIRCSPCPTRGPIILMREMIGKAPGTRLASDCHFCAGRIIIGNLGRRAAKKILVTYAGGFHRRQQADDDHGVGSCRRRAAFSEGEKLDSKTGQLGRLEASGMLWHCKIGGKPTWHHRHGPQLGAAVAPRAFRL